MLFDAGAMRKLVAKAVAHAMIFRMSGSGNLVVQTNVPGGARAALAELVQAWARDVATGTPIHILELGPERRGAKSGCECPSCGLGLMAVNAAKTEFVKRPHFRHPEGAARDECLLLAARAAAMRQLQEEGWLDLPRRQMSARATGLSGQAHEAWVELPAERVRITEVDFRDRAVAMLTLDDGRQLRVELTGTLAGSDGLVFDASGHPVPTILLAVDDPSLAGMAPDELRRRLKLLPSGVCWRAHWDDAELARQAAAAARSRALFYFDEVPDGLDLPADLDPALKRQTVLHHEVMKLLAESQLLHVPGWVAEAESAWPDGRVERRRAESEPEWLSLELVELEERFGHIVPDVTSPAMVMVRLSCEIRPTSAPPVSWRPQWRASRSISRTTGPSTRTCHLPSSSTCSTSAGKTVFAPQHMPSPAGSTKPMRSCEVPGRPSVSQRWTWSAIGAAARDTVASDIGMVSERQLSPTKMRVSSVESPTMAARSRGKCRHSSKSVAERSSIRVPRRGPSSIRTAQRP